MELGWYRKVKGTVSERLALAVVDRVSAVARRESCEELRRFAARLSAEDALCDPLEHGVGTWERRLRELLARGWPG